MTRATFAQKSLVNTVKRRMLMLAVAATALTSVFWIYSELGDFRIRSTKLRAEFLEQHKTLLRKELAEVIDYIEYKRGTADTRLMDTIRKRVNEATAIADHVTKVKKNSLSQSELQSVVREALRPIRWNNGRGYYFAIDMDGTEQLFPPDPSIEQTKVTDIRDPNGQPVITDLIRLVNKRQKGFYKYLWPKPGSNTNYPKVTYVKGVPALGWIIGTGEYLDDVKQDIQAEVLARIEKIRFGKAGYIFAIAADSTVLAYGQNPASAGTVLSANKTSPSYDVFTHGLEEAKKAGGGFYQYAWQKPDASGEHNKLTHFRYVDEWNWLLGAGVYLDEIEIAIAAMEEQLKNDIIGRMLKISALIIILLLAITLSARLLAARINHSFELFTKFFTRAASGTAYISPDDLEFAEFKRLTSPANRMIEEKTRALEHLEQNKRELEKRVQEKTAKLQKMNEELRNSEELLRVTFNSTGDGILVTDNKGTIIKLNPMLRHLWNIPPDISPEASPGIIEFIQDQLFQPETLKANQPLIQQGQDSFDELKCKDGRIVERYIYPLISEREVIGRIYNFRDITEKKYANEQVKSLRMHLGDIVNSMPSILIAVDSNANITQWNAAATEKIGVSSNDALGVYLPSVFHAITNEMHHVEKVLKEREPQIILKQPLIIGKERRYTDITIYPLGTGAQGGAVIRLDDITDRVNMEDMMVQTEKMLSLGGLAAGMAHEINNPLGAILQSCQNILRRLSPSMSGNITSAQKYNIDLNKLALYLEDRKITSYLNGIQESGMRAATIVRSMLDFSRKSESEKSKLDMRIILDNAIEFASKDYDLKKKYDFRLITINKEYAEELPEVLGIATELEQVFLNLLKNAGQAMADKEYRDSKPTITIRIKPDGEFVLVEVEDNGPGIDTTMKKRIFEPFYTTKKVGIGTGLGLSVSYFIVTRNHNGEFRVDSRAGEWTKFSIHLPRPLPDMSA